MRQEIYNLMTSQIYYRRQPPASVAKWISQWALARRVEGSNPTKTVNYMVFLDLKINPSVKHFPFSILRHWYICPWRPWGVWLSSFKFIFFTNKKRGPYHESVCRCRKVRATWTKLPDFVPLDICQVPGSQFWSLFFKKLKNLDVENFWGSSSIRWKSEKIEKKFFLLTKPIFSGSIWIVHVLSFHLRCIVP